MRSIAHHDHGQKPERMKFLRIIFGCPEGAGKWRILFFAMLLHSKKDNTIRRDCALRMALLLISAEGQESLRRNRTPSVFLPQCEEIVQPARVRKTSLKGAS